ncbi:MAG: methylmalonyl Co-A mutase-associated GTPase MeaB [Anaerolineales bacterium]
MFDPTPILSGDRRALARLLTRIENGAPEAERALAALFPHTGRAHLVGVTGPPGSGKSTLVNELAKALRGAGQTVAIVAVDPSSPFTGGAILGDRIRMRDLAGDPGVFIRSMASRGALGGLARATADVVKALDAAGFETILIETVGAGQAEVDIARAAHTVLVVEAPGLGDDVQAIKAGLLEVADVLVVNKADQPGAESAVRALRASLDLAAPAARKWTNHSGAHHADLTPPSPPQSGESWRPPILQTVATQGKGVAELVKAIEQHRDYSNASGELARRERERLAHELETRLRDALLEGWLARVGNGQLAAALDQILARAIDPASAARELVNQMHRSMPI